MRELDPGSRRKHAVRGGEGRTVDVYVRRGSRDLKYYWFDARLVGPDDGEGGPHNSEKAALDDATRYYGGST